MGPYPFDRGLPLACEQTRRQGRVQVQTASSAENALSRVLAC